MEVVRLLGFFVVVLLVLRVAQQLPLVGSLFRIPFLGFWLSAILVSVVASRWATTWVDRRKQRALERQLGAVDTPHNLGKLGSLLLSQGRAKEALAYLERAVAGEPDVPEWRYRSGCAYLRLKREREAIEALERCLELEEEYAYGGALLRLAEAHQSSGDPTGSLAQLERYELGHGPSPESAYRKGLALKALGKKQEASESFAAVSELVRSAPAYQKRGAWGWIARAALARF